MTEKDLIAIFNNDFQNGGDCYGEELISINWNSLQPSDECDREEGCKVVAGLSPSGSGFVWLCIKNGKLYTNWETKMATTLIEDDGSDYYKELYDKVRELCPEISLKKQFRVTRCFWEKPSEVVIEIVSEENGCTYFGIRNVNPYYLSEILEQEIPTIKFGTEKHDDYPFGPCLKVESLHCKLNLEEIYDCSTVATFIVYK